jgi:hypothetical protein
MSRRTKFNRRDFLTGVFRGRSLNWAAKPQEHTGEHTSLSPDFQTLEGLADIPAWEGSLDLVLKQMDDLTVIEDP